MKTYFIILTQYGDRYKTDKDGYVLEYSNGLKKDENSDNRKSWKIIGLSEILPFAKLSRVYSLNECLNIKNFRYKNRKPKFVINDIDNGTSRIHGNSQYHGVINLYKQEN